MKLALLTFHNAANYGAALQAYGLQTFLESKGYDCEYLNYVNRSRAEEYSMSSHIIKSIKKGDFSGAVKYLLGTPFMELRKYRFQEFFRQRLKVSSEIYTNAEEASKAEHIYDKFIVGSDQVWCPENNGNDVAFLLSFVKDREKKISYSSSFGLAEIPEDLKDDYKRCLSDIKYLSTREQYGCKLIKDLTGRNATLVMDPVFLLSAVEWAKLLPKRNDEEMFIFSYTNRADQLSCFLKQTNYPLKGKYIYKLSTQTSPKDFLDREIKVKYTMAPIDFLQSIRDAEFVVTASFHCLAFSIIFHKPFVCFLTGNEGKDERLKNVLTYFGLLDRVVTENMTIEQVQKPIDYKYVDEVLAEKCKDSISFLLNALS